MELRANQGVWFWEERGAGGGKGGAYHVRTHGLAGRGLGGAIPNIFGGGAQNSRYTLEFTAMVDNVFKNINLGVPVGNLGSPLFGKSNYVASWIGYRRLDL